MSGACSSVTAQQISEWNWPLSTRIWVLVGLLDDSVRRLFACWCVTQQAWAFLDWRFRLAIELAERYARGAATASELAKHYDNAIKARDQLAATVRQECQTRGAAGASREFKHLAACAAVRAAQQSLPTESVIECAEMSTLVDPVRQTVAQCRAEQLNTLIAFHQGNPPENRTLKKAAIARR